MKTGARSILFAQMAKAERAGLPWNTTIALMNESCSGVFGKVLARFERNLESGMDIAQAGKASGLFFSWEARLIAAASKCGKLGHSLAALSRRYDQRALLYSRLKRGLYLPLLVFVLAVFIAPLGSLLTDSITARQYLLAAGGRVGLLFGGLYLLARSWKRLNVLGSDSSLHGLILRIPYFGPLIRRQQQRDFLDCLAVALEAGMPAFEALETATRSVSNSRIRRELMNSVGHARDGSSLADALAACNALPDEDSKNLLRSGEVSGRTQEMLRHLVTGIDEHLVNQYQAISDWTPRFAYALLIVLILSAWQAG